MLTPLSILSLDQGKLWREPPAEAAPRDPVDEPHPVRDALALLRRRLTPTRAPTPAGPARWRLRAPLGGH
jgi:hypothetical protein